MAINFKKHNSLTRDELVAMHSGGAIANNTNREPVDKTAWYKAPAGLEQFRIPDKDVLVKFDVLEYKLTNQYHQHFLDANCWDARGKYYWNYNVRVHECFPKTIVCNKNYDLKRAGNDPICNLLWDEKDEYDYKRFNKSYTILLLRVHPNEELGIDDYKFMYYIDTPGKLVKAIDEAYSKAMTRKDYTKIQFFSWYDEGCTVEAFFSELDTPLGFKFRGCNDVTFVRREEPLTEDDCTFLEELDMCAGVPKPTEEEYAEFIEYFKAKAPHKDGTVGTAESVKAPEKVEEAPAKPADPVFANKADDNESIGDDWADVEQ